MSGVKDVHYTIVSVPKEIKLRCPYCDEDVTFPASDFCDEELWYGNVGVECPECQKEILLGGCDYD